MFNDRYILTNAAIKGIKQLTRRIMRNQSGNLAGQIKYTKKGSDLIHVRADFDNGISEDCHYAIGEIVAVAQCYGSLVIYNSDRCYPELTKKINKAHNLCCEHIGHLEEVAGWTNKMLVKAELMPHQIRILDVRAERLQDITEEDCVREGVRKLPYTTGDGNTYYSYWNGVSNQPRYHSKNNEVFSDTHYSGVCSNKTEEEASRIVFSKIIDRISGKGTWNNNPFVWRIEFELLK